MSKFEFCTIILLAVVILVNMYNTLRIEHSIKKFMITFMFYKEKEKRQENPDD